MLYYQINENAASNNSYCTSVPLRYFNEENVSCNALFFRTQTNPKKLFP